MTKIYIGLKEKDDKVQTVTSIEMSDFDIEEAKEVLLSTIDFIYETREGRGEN